MNRAVKALVATFTLIVAVAAPASGEPSERTETLEYSSTSGTQLMDYFTVQVGPLPEIRPARGETAVSVVVEDASGRPVAAAVHQGDQDLGNICGATKGPVPLVSRKAVHVHVFSGAGCSDVSLPTQGTITFTFVK